jgi:hypothetical protein
MERHALGMLTLLLLAAAGGLWCGGATLGVDPVVPAALLRMAIMLGIIWIAVPNIHWLLARIPAWLLGTTLVFLAVMVVRPRATVVLLPVLLLLWVLTPRWFGRK